MAGAIQTTSINHFEITGWVGGIRPQPREVHFVGNLSVPQKIDFLCYTYINSVAIFNKIMNFLLKVDKIKAIKNKEILVFYREIDAIRILPLNRKS